MRLLGAVHRLVLDGRLPELARHYPSAGGSPRFPEAANAFIEAIEAKRGEVRAALDTQVQTNEVNRSTVLLPGFLEVAQRTRLPLRILEIGASAGLNQLFDRHRYELGPHHWGTAEAPLCLKTQWHGRPPALDAPLRVSERAACDLFPVDIAAPEALSRLESFVWPDQPERLQRLRLAAAAVAAEELTIDCEAALPWLERQLAEDRPGMATVLFHSVVWWYVPRDQQTAIEEQMLERGRAASEDAPLAWLRMEGTSLERCELRLTSWPGGEERLLAECGFHGQFIRWLD
jgi:hypothetical protein